MIKMGQTVTQDFTLHNPVTGFVQNADFQPQCEIFADDIDVSILTPVVINRLGFNGIYRVTFTVSIANGFAYGSSYNVDVIATVNSITTRATVLVFDLEAAPKPKAVFAI